MSLQFGSVGPMAITLCQSLGQNIGMLKKKERPVAGENAGRGKTLTICVFNFQLIIIIISAPKILHFDLRAFRVLFFLFFFLEIYGNNLSFLINGSLKWWHGNSAEQDIKLH